MERSHDDAGLCVTMSFFVPDEDDKLFRGRVAGADEADPGFVYVEDADRDMTAVYVDGLLVDSLRTWYADEVYGNSPRERRAGVMDEHSTGLPVWPHRLESVRTTTPPCSRPKAVLVFDTDQWQSAIYVAGALVGSGWTGSPEMRECLAKHQITQTLSASMIYNYPDRHYWPFDINTLCLKGGSA